MRFSLRHILLVLSLIAVITSFLFFGRLHETYTILLIAGLTLAAISYLWLLIKDNKKSKVIWTLAMVLSILLQQLTERAFIRQSFKILIESNQEVLDKVNFIFMSVPGEIMYLKGTTNSKFSKQDREIISQLFRQTNIHLIMKDSSKIFYETYGMLDSRVGVSFLYSKSKTDFGTGLNTFTGKWQY